MSSRLLMAFAVVSVLVPLGGCGGGTSSSPPPPSITVFVTPTLATVKVGAQLPFAAVVAGTSNPAVVWKVNGVVGGTPASGTINASGVYVAPSVPPTPPNVTITATASADMAESGAASVTVTIGVTVLPTTVTLNVDTPECPVSQQFSALVMGSTNSNVNWGLSVLSTGNSSADFGSINAAGVYIPPATIPTPAQFTVTAISRADTTQSANASVTITAGGAGVDQSVQGAPIELGTSGGNANDKSGSACCSGTLGALVARNGANFVLSNNHVLARNDQAQAGEAIVQPGLVDTQCVPGTPVARFSQAVKLQNTDNTAIADAALARVMAGQVDPTGAILGLGPVSCGVAQAAAPASTTVAAVVGMPVAKSGRSTGLTCGSIGEIAVDGVQVHYSNSCGSTSSFVVTFNNQVVVDSPSFGSAGDSGSLVVKADTAEPTALLFAGDVGTGVAIANPIQSVLAALPDSANQALPTIVGGSPHAVTACGVSANSSHLRQNAAVAARPLDSAVVRAMTVKSTHLAELRADPAVVGVGVGAGENPGEAAIVIFIERGKRHGALPASLDGVPVRTKIIGPIQAFDGAACIAEMRSANGLRVKSRRLTKGSRRHRGDES